MLFSLEILWRFFYFSVKIDCRKKIPVYDIMANKSKTELAETTVKEYARIISAIKESGYKDDDIDSMKAYFEEKQYSIMSKRTNINACRNKYKNRPEYEEYNNKMKEWLGQLVQQSKDEKEEQKKSGKEDAKHMDWDKVLDLSLKAMNNEKYSLADRILIGLYTQLDPVRIDYTYMKLYKEDPKLTKGSYFVINDDVQQVVITEHKNLSAHGIIRQPLPERLAEMITMWFSDEDVLFPISEKNMSRQIIQLFHKVVGKPMTANALRHSRITFMFKNAPAPKESKMVARNMGHSVGTQQAYRFAPE